MSEDIQKIGVLVKKRRKKLHITQPGLAKRAGISTIYVKRIESGSSTPSAIIMAKIAKALGVSTDYFLRHIKNNEQLVDERLDALMKRVKYAAMAPRDLDFEAKQQLIQILEELTKANKK